jgi:hypothetical protein
MIIEENELTPDVFARAISALLSTDDEEVIVKLTPKNIS